MPWGPYTPSAAAPRTTGEATTAIFEGLSVLEEAVEGGGWSARLRVEPSSRAFAGHFEDAPILPGVAHLVVVAHALRALGTSLRELPWVRFRHAVAPGDLLDVRVSAEENGRYRFDIHVAGTLAASGAAVGTNAGG
jgi:3-hydroxymyristoyl/3-hydroxydecanoyl-(acyl carrier protein) dehydratase